VFTTPSIVTVLHAGDNDLVQLKRRGFAFSGLFDTSIAARFLGAKALGLDVLLGTYLGVELPPSRQRDDWSRRPLSEAQRRYAESDVLHLFALKARLTEELERVGRLAWVQEECAALAAQPAVERVADPQAFARLKCVTCRRTISRSCVSCTSSSSSSPARWIARRSRSAPRRRWSGWLKLLRTMRRRSR
jgi:ribonuclease D